MTTPYLDRILECKDDDNIVLLRDKGNAETIISARHFKREIEALIADRETLVAKLNSIAYRSSLPDSYEEGFDEAIGAAIKIVSGDENLNLWKREDEDTRYAAAQREIEALREEVSQLTGGVTVHYISRQRVEDAIEAAAQSTYGDSHGRCLGNWEIGFEDGRGKTIKRLCEALGLSVPKNHKRFKGEL